MKGQGSERASDKPSAVELVGEPGEKLVRMV